jgi:hypothetical protein
MRVNASTKEHVFPNHGAVSGRYRDFPLPRLWFAQQVIGGGRHLARHMRELSRQRAAVALTEMEKRPLAAALRSPTGRLGPGNSAVSGRRAVDLDGKPPRGLGRELHAAREFPPAKSSRKCGSL